MAWEKKYQVFLGIFLIHFPNGVTWYYGNLSSYTASALRCYLGPKVDVETVWLLSIFIGMWTTGLTLCALLQKVFHRPRLIVFGGFLVFDAAFVATSWTIQHSLALYVLSFGALTGLADGFIYTACMTYIPMWEKNRVGLSTALVTSGLGVGAVVINQIISRYVNPNNEVADKPDGNLMLFSQEEISTRVPKLFLFLAVFNFIFHIFGLLLLKTKTGDEVRDNDTKEDSQSLLLVQDTKPVVVSKEFKEDKDTAGFEGNESIDGMKGLSARNDMLRQAIKLFNCDVAPETENDFLISKADLWSSTECLESNLSQLSVFYQQCLHICQTGACEDKENVKTMSFTLNPDKSFKEYFRQWRDSKIFEHSPEMNIIPFSAEENLAKEYITSEDHLFFFRLWSRTSLSSCKNLCDDSCRLNVNANVDDKADGTHHNNTENPRTTSNDMNSDKTSTGVQSLNTSYGSIFDTSEANDLNTEDTEMDTGLSLQYEITSESRNFTPKEMACNKMFFMLCLTQFTMDYSLSVLINYYKLYGEIHIPDDHFLAYLGTVMTASLIIPKLGWGWALDLWGVKDTLMCMTSCTVLISSFWYFTATINRYLYSGLTLALCWCVSAIDSLAAAAVLKAFGPAHFNINYGLVASSSIFFNMVTPLGMKALVNNLGWAGLFLSVGIMNFVILVLTFFYTSK